MADDIFKECISGLPAAKEIFRLYSRISRGFFGVRVCVSMDLGVSVLNSTQGSSKKRRNLTSLSDEII